MSRRLGLYLAFVGLWATLILARHMPEPTLTSLGWIFAVGAVSTLSLYGAQLQKDVSIQLDAVVAVLFMVILGPAVTFWGYTLSHLVNDLIQTRDWRKFLFNASSSAIQNYIWWVLLVSLARPAGSCPFLFALSVALLARLVTNNALFSVLFSILRNRPFREVAQEVVGGQWALLLAEHTLAALGIFVYLAGGWAWLTVLGVQLLFLWLMMRQIGQLTQKRLQAEYAATHDGLTGLLNRTAFAAALDRAEAEARQRQGIFAIGMLDLNGFKEINDGLGHAEGDLALQRFANELQKAVGPADLIARLGGDEFAVLMPATRSEEADAKLLHFADKISYATDASGRTYTLSASVGIAAYPRDGLTGSELLAQADRHMYGRKRRRPRAQEIH